MTALHKGQNQSSSGNIITPLSIFVVCAAYFSLALWAFSSPFITGDEIFSVQQAANLRLSYQGMIYHSLLSLWLQVSDDAIWLRVPGVILGALSIPIMWFWLRSLRGARVADLGILFLICAPVFMALVVFLRLYSLFILTSVLFFSVYTHLARLERRLTPSEIALLVFSAILVLTAHLFGLVVIGLVIVHWAVAYPKRAPVWLWIGLALVSVIAVGALALLIISPNTVAQLYQHPVVQLIFSQIGLRGGAIEGPKGLSLVILAKQPLLFFEFVFGSQVYPLQLLIVIPGLVAAVLLALLGIRRLFQSGDRFAAAFPIVIALGGLFITTAVFDPLVPPMFIASVSTRHLAFIIPVFFWVIAEGVLALKPRVLRWILGGIFAASQLFGLWSLYRPDYNAMDYAALMSHIESLESEPDVIILTEGRTDQFMSQNYRGALPFHNMWDYPIETGAFADLILPSRRIFFMSADFKDGNRCILNQYLLGAERWRNDFTLITYPLIAYQFDRTMPPDDSQSLLPPSFFHLRFRDIRLPAQIEWDARKLQITSPFSLPTCRRERIYSVSPANGEGARRLLLLSNVVAPRPVPLNTVVGAITVTAKDRQTQRFEVRMGMETASWDANACAAPCFSALQWEKLAHFLGFSAYPRANDQFTAHIWGAELALDGRMDVESIALEVEPDFEAEWNIWGLYLLDG